MSPIVTLSNGGNSVQIYTQRDTASRLAILMEGVRARTSNGKLHPDLQQLLDSLDHQLLSSAQPASISNRPLVPYFTEKREPNA